MVLTGRKIVNLIHAFFRIFDVQGRAVDLNGQLSIELRSDNLKKFDEAREETLMAMEKELDRNLLDGLYCRQLENVESHEDCLCAL